MVTEKKAEDLEDVFPFFIGCFLGSMLVFQHVANWVSCGERGFR